MRRHAFKEYSVGILPSLRSQTLKKALTNPDSIGVFITCVGIIGNDIVQTDAPYYGSRQVKFQEPLAVNRLKVVDPPVRELIYLIRVKC